MPAVESDRARLQRFVDAATDAEIELLAKALVDRIDQLQAQGRLAVKPSDVTPRTDAAPAGPSTPRFG